MTAESFLKSERVKQFTPEANYAVVATIFFADWPYVVQIKTQDVYQAGTNNNVYIEMEGTGGSCERSHLDSAGHNDFERDRCVRCRHVRNAH